MTIATQTDELMLALCRLQSDLRHLVSKQDVNMAVTSGCDPDEAHRIARAVRELEEAGRVLDEAVSAIKRD